MEDILYSPSVPWYEVANVHFASCFLLGIFQGVLLHIVFEDCRRKIKKRKLQASKVRDIFRSLETATHSELTNKVIVKRKKPVVSTERKDETKIYAAA